MTEVSLIKMKAHGLPPGGEKGRTRRGNLTAVAESDWTSQAGKNGADWHMANVLTSSVSSASLY